MILVLLVTGFALASNAQEEKKKTVIELPQWVKNIKLSGYGMLQYQVQNPDDKTENSFNLRRTWQSHRHACRPLCRMAEI